MEGRNCPNCGAALDPELCKCPYCGTSYFDLSAIDIDHEVPFYIKTRTMIAGKPAILTALVRLNSDMSMIWSSNDDVIINLEFQVYKKSMIKPFKVEIMEEEK